MSVPTSFLSALVFGPIPAHNNASVLSGVVSHELISTSIIVYTSPAFNVIDFLNNGGCVGGLIFQFRVDIPTFFVINPSRTLWHIFTYLVEWMLFSSVIHEQNNLQIYLRMCTIPLTHLFASLRLHLAGDRFSSDDF